MSGTDDLSNFRQEISDLKRRLRELENASPLQSASVSRGRLRFIGGLLRIDSGGRLEIVGSLAIEGSTTITGITTVTGSFSVDGPWEIAGNGTISGNVSITGAVTISGDVSLLSNLTLGASGRIRFGSVELSSGVGGSGGMSAPVQIVLVTPLVDVQGGINVEQGAVLRGNVTTPNLPTISESASGLTRNSIYVHPTTRQFYRVVP